MKILRQVGRKIIALPVVLAIILISQPFLGRKIIALPVVLAIILISQPFLGRKIIALPVVLAIILISQPFLGRKIIALQAILAIILILLLRLAAQSSSCMYINRKEGGVIHKAADLYRTRSQNPRHP